MTAKFKVRLEERGARVGVEEGEREVGEVRRETRSMSEVRRVMVRCGE